MKKLLLSIAVACVAVICSTNQTFAQSNKTRIGIKAGADLMTLGTGSTNGLTVSYDSRPGFQGGVYFETTLTDKIIFSPQVLYTQKGGNIKTVISGYTVTGSTQVDYIDVPLLVGFKPQPNLTFYIGPEISFLLSQTTTATVVGVGSNSSTDKTGLRKAVFGGNLGVGYSFTNNVGLNLHYLFDLQHAAESAADSGERSSGLALSVSYLF